MTQLYTMTVRMKQIDRTNGVENISFREKVMTMMPIHTCNTWKRDFPDSVVSIVAEEVRDTKRPSKQLPYAQGVNHRNAESRATPPRAKSPAASPSPTASGYAGAINHAIGQI